MALWQQGKLIAGRYEILGLIATGGMAEVYLAETRGPQGVQRVALKRILPHLGREAEFVTMFLDEVSVAAALRHPGIVSVVDTVTEHGELMLVLEYVPGWDLSAILREAVKTQRVIDDAIVASIARDVAHTLGYVHNAMDARGTPLHVVHRDVTPSNILIGADGRARLLDFGVAKAAQRLTRTATRTLKGKFAYMAPEQARGAPVDARTDLYALGLVLFEVLTGRRANDGTDDVGLLERAREPRHAPVRLLRPQVHPILERVVMQLLAPDAAGRPPTGEEVVASLSTLPIPEDSAERVRMWMLETMGTAERPVGGQSSTLERALAKVAGLQAATPDGEATRRESPHQAAEQAVSSATPIVGGPLPKTASERRSSWWVLGGLGAIAAAALVVLALGAMARTWLVSEPRPTPSRPVATASVGFFRLTSDPTGAAVVVDGTRWIEPTPTVVEVPTGREHSLELHLDGYTSHRQSATAAAGRSVPIHVFLMPILARLTVTSEPTGARVRLSGEDVGVTPITLDDLPRTAVPVSVSLDGYASFETTATLDADAEVSVVARLRERPEVGTLDVFCEPWATVEIDGRLMAESTPAAGLRLAPGEHTVRLRNPVVGLSAQRRVTITAGRRTRLSVSLR